MSCDRQNCIASAAFVNFGKVGMTVRIAPRSPMPPHGERIGIKLQGIGSLGSDVSVVGCCEGGVFFRVLGTETVVFARRQVAS